jgi:hypothetical protein
VAVLRAELTSTRSKLDAEAILARAASDQLERDRQLLARAEQTLAQVLSHVEGDAESS